ncbi:MAG: hypothetical protein GXY44_11285 [Phycisphaerales bacterium]|nr:hypothetical protein [Phycisphaerales bacterium]
MSVRFIIGRAGSGKTWRCLEAIRTRLREDAAGGPRLLLLVPEQASFQMERALIETPDLAGYTRCEVLSFQRLAYRIFAERGIDPRSADQTIGPLGRLMVIRRLIRLEKSALTILDRVADKPGLVRQVANTIEELMREAVDPPALVELAERLEESNPLAAAWTGDLTRLYRAYLDHLIDDRLDPAQYLQLAAERLDQCPWLCDAEVWVDGFAGFTRQEYHLLTELARRVRSMEMTLLLDPRAAAVTADSIPWLSYSLFARTERTLARLGHDLKAAGIDVLEPILLQDSCKTGLPRPETPTHCTGETPVPHHVNRLQKAARHMPGHRPCEADEKHRRDAGATPASESIPAGDTPATERIPEDSTPSRFQAPALVALENNLFRALTAEAGPITPETVRALDFPDRRTEVAAAVAEIERLTRRADPPMRYRDIAVIVRDLGEYHDLIAAALRGQGIPCFLDRREPTTHHPLVELVRSLLALAADDCRSDAARLSLKTDLLNLDTREADLLENYVLACGIVGRTTWKEEWTSTRYFPDKARNEEDTKCQQEVLREINHIRRRWWARVGSWLDWAAAHPDATGREWAEAFYACLEQAGVGARLADWAEQDEGDGRGHEADMHRQIWVDFVELLDEFVKALGTESIHVSEFRETLEAALAEFNLGLAPPTLDQVLVGSIERSRHPPVRAVLLLGFDECYFPLHTAEDPLLGDVERELLAKSGREIGPTRRQQLLNERMLAYIALTRASERVWISWPRADGQGKPLRPSPYLQDVLRALPGLTVEKIAEPWGERSLDWVARINELGGRLAAEFRRRGEPDQDAAPDKRALFNAVYERVREQSSWTHTLRSCFGGLGYRNEARLESGLIERATRDPFAASVSRLERFAACPFAHFADYFLKLKARVEPSLNVMDLGTVCHAVLEKFVDSLAKEQRSLAELAEDEINERVDRISGEMLPELAGDMLLAEARNAYLYDRSRFHLHRSLRRQWEAARLGRYRPAAVEFPFGMSARTPAATLTTPKGRRVLLRGLIDRVDVAELADELLGVVIDYKRTTERKLDWTQAYHGLSVQLVTYLLALRQVGQSLTGRPIRPVAALYLPLIEPFQTVAHPSEPKKPIKWRGVIDVSRVDTLDGRVDGAGTASDFISAAITKKGENVANSDLLDSDQFEVLLRHVRRRIGELADALLDGDISVRPYRLNRTMPCGFCKFSAVCRYEIETQPPRLLEGMGSKTQVLERIMQEAEDAGSGE